MVVTYEASKLSRLIAQHAVEKINFVTCGLEEYEELWNEAINAGLDEVASDSWFSLQGLSFTIHLDTEKS